MNNVVCLFTREIVTPAPVLDIEALKAKYMHPMHLNTPAELAFEAYCNRFICDNLTARLDISLKSEYTCGVYEGSIYKRFDVYSLNPECIDIPINDPFAYLDTKYKTTLNILKQQAETGPVKITTCSDLIIHDNYIKEIPKGSTIRLIYKVGLIGFGSLKRMEIAYNRLLEAGMDVSLEHEEA